MLSGFPMCPRLIKPCTLQFSSHIICWFADSCCCWWWWCCCVYSILTFLECYCYLFFFFPFSARWMMRCAAWIRCSAEFSNILSCLCLSGSLMYLNEATLLNNIRVRYSKDKIYVSTDMRGSGRSVKYCETEMVVRSSSSSPCCIHSWTQWCVAPHAQDTPEAQPSGELVALKMKE